MREERRTNDFFSNSLIKNLMLYKITLDYECYDNQR